MQVTFIPMYRSRYAHFNVENGFDCLFKCNVFETRSSSKPDVTFVLILYSHLRALKSGQALLRLSDMISMIDRLERKSVTDKLPLTVRSHVCRNINKGRDIKSASDMA